MTNVQQIEASVGYDDSFSSRAQGLDATRQFVQQYDFPRHLTTKFSARGMI
jgi:hypothetical protein